MGKLSYKHGMKYKVYLNFSSDDVIREDWYQFDEDYCYNDYQDSQTYREVGPSMRISYDYTLCCYWSSDKERTFVFTEKDESLKIKLKFKDEIQGNH